MTPIAGLNDYQRQRLAEVLRKCAVQIRAGATTGTGIFIEPRQVPAHDAGYAALFVAS